MTYQKRYWERVKHRREVREAYRRGQRSAADYARESALDHGKFLADAAESFMEAVNQLESMTHDDVVCFSNEDIEEAESYKSDSWASLKSAIHEFRKRV